MCNAKNLRHRADAIVDLALAMQLAMPMDDLPEFEPRYRIGIKQQGLILKPLDGRLTWSWARWGLVPPGAKGPQRYALNNARSDKLGNWPWKTVAHKRCLVPTSGFWEPEKATGVKGTVPWRYYCMKSDAPFFMAGLWSDAKEPDKDETGDSYTVIIDSANGAIHIHNRMPVILDPGDAATWLTADELPANLLKPYDGDLMHGWRVPDEARNSRIRPHEGMWQQAAN